MTEQLAADALPPGSVLGGVVIERAIGRGASAVVYSGQDIATLAPRALKVWSPAAGAGADVEAARRQFLLQARNALALRHPGIVRVFGSGTESGLSFIVMELLAGATLARHVAPVHRLPVSLVLDIGAQLAEALGHAHRQGVVHRDVKPANALFDPATRRAVLTDFGLSRASDTQSSRSGMFLGTPVYMAPELLGGEPPDASTDLYALGVLLYALLAGRPPFENPSMGALLRAVMHEPPPSLAEWRADWPPGVATRLDTLLAPLLAKQAEQRPADGPTWAAAAREAARAMAAPTPPDD